MSRYQPYEEYKNSGFEWFGDIPKHWITSRLKNVVKEPLMYGANEAALEVNKSHPRFVRITDVEANGELRDDTFRSLPPDLAEPYLLSSGDILLARSGATVGKSFIYNDSWGISCFAGYLIKASINDREHCANFMYYYTQTDYYWSWISSIQIQATIQNVSAEKYNNFLLCFPESTKEQKTIAAFLDYETGKIDQLIKKQQDLIALLDEKRQAVISHAVTKGLDPNVLMKDSGVEWLGEVPEHWEVLGAKRFFRLVTEPAAANNDHELLSVYTDIGVRPRKDLEQKGNKASTTDGYWLVNKGDIIVNKLLAWMGAVGYSDYDGVTSPAYDILRATRKLIPKFYHYLFRTDQANSEFKRWSRGIMEMRLRLYFEELGRINMPFPPSGEQAQIVAYLDDRSNKCDDLISKAKSAIELMQERRTALISAAVTGKIDVREWEEKKDKSEGFKDKREEVEI